MNNPAFSWSGDIHPALICLVIVGIAITYAIIFALARRETKRHHAQALDMHASNVGLERMRNETNEALALRIRDVMRYQPQSGKRDGALLGRDTNGNIVEVPNRPVTLGELDQRFDAIVPRWMRTLGRFVGWVKGKARGSKPTSARAFMFRGSLYSALILSAVGSLHQDWIGRDAYIQLVHQHWVDARITVPIAIVALVFGIVAYCVDAVRANGNRTGPRSLRKCQCQWEQGDSPCPIHGENEE